MKKVNFSREFYEFLFRFPRRDFTINEPLRRFTPKPIRDLVNYFRYKILPLTEMVRIDKRISKYLGQEFPPTQNKIEIDITYNCNLRCPQCNRFLGVAPCQVQMSVSQIDKFLKESIEQKRTWEGIWLSGGEPVLHPDITEIVGLLVKFKKEHSPDTQLYILSNGLAKDKLSILPEQISVYDSQKDKFGPRHIPIMVAPKDLPAYKNSDFSNGCYIPAMCATGLGPYGYYQCTVAAAIDRIMGLDIGRKHLPSPQDNMIDLYRAFCGYCGFFIRSEKSRQGLMITESWKDYLEKYAKFKPILTPY